MRRFASFCFVVRDWFLRLCWLHNQALTAPADLPFDAWWRVYRSYHVSTSAWQRGRSASPSNTFEKGSTPLEESTAALGANPHTSLPLEASAVPMSKGGEPARLNFDEAEPPVVFPRAAKRRSMSKMRPPSVRTVQSAAAAGASASGGSRSLDEASSDEPSSPGSAMSSRLDYAKSNASSTSRRASGERSPRTSSRSPSPLASRRLLGERNLGSIPGSPSVGPSGEGSAMSQATPPAEPATPPSAKPPSSSTAQL